MIRMNKLDEEQEQCGNYHKSGLLQNAGRNENDTDIHNEHRHLQHLIILTWAAASSL